MHSRLTGVSCGDTNLGVPCFGVENFGRGEPFKGERFIGELKLNLKVADFWLFVD